MYACRVDARVRALLNKLSIRACECARSHAQLEHPAVVCARRSDRTGRRRSQGGNEGLRVRMPANVERTRASSSQPNSAAAAAAKPEATEAPPLPVTPSNKFVTQLNDIIILVRECASAREPMCALSPWRNDLTHMRGDAAMSSSTVCDLSGVAGGVEAAHVHERHRAA